MKILKNRDGAIKFDENHENPYNVPDPRVGLGKYNFCERNESGSTKTSPIDRAHRARSIRAIFIKIRPIFFHFLRIG